MFSVKKMKKKHPTMSYSFYLERMLKKLTGKKRNTDLLIIAVDKLLLEVEERKFYIVLKSENDYGGSSLVVTVSLPVQDYLSKDALMKKNIPFIRLLELIHGQVMDVRIMKKINTDDSAELKIKLPFNQVKTLKIPVLEAVKYAIDRQMPVMMRKDFAKPEKIDLKKENYIYNWMSGNMVAAAWIDNENQFMETVQ